MWRLLNQKLKYLLRVLTQSCNVLGFQTEGPITLIAIHHRSLSPQRYIDGGNHINAAISRARAGASALRRHPLDRDAGQNHNAICRAALKSAHQSS